MNRSVRFLHLYALAFMLALLTAAPLAWGADDQLIRNPTLADTDGNGSPDNWYKLTQFEGTVEYRQADGVDFVRIGGDGSGENCILQQFAPVPEDGKPLRITGRVRWDDIKRGEKNWQVGNIQIMFADDNQKKIGNYVGLRSMTGSSDGWQDITQTFTVPAGASQFRVQAALYSVSSGTLDIASVHATAGEPGPQNTSKKEASKQPTSPSANRAPQAQAGSNLLTNSLLQDGDGNGKPDGWQNPTKDQGKLTYKQGDSGAYLRLGDPQQPQNCILQQWHPLPAGAEQLTLAAKLRWSGIARGDAGWKVGNVQLMFEDANRKRVGPFLGMGSLTGSSDGWQTSSKTFDVPDSAVKYRVQVALYNVSKGELDVAWVTAAVGKQAVDPAGAPATGAQAIKTKPAEKPAEPRIPLPTGDGPEYAGVRGVSLLGDDPLGRLEPYRQVQDFTAERFTVEGQPFTDAVRVTQRVQPKASWDMQLRGKATAPINTGDKLLLTYYLRGIDVDSEFAEATFVTTLERNSGSWKKSIHIGNRQLIGTDWVKLQRVFVANQTLKPEDLAFSFQFGFEPQTFEVGGLSLYNYGPGIDADALPQTPRALYEGYASDHPWRDEAAQRIEQHRMGNLQITVVDADGNPLPGASVHVKMTRHAFGWGTAIDRWTAWGTSDSARTYRRNAAKLFNLIALENGHKWGTWESDDKNRTAIKAVVDWALGSGMDVRGHTAVWPSFKRSPDRLKALRHKPDELRAEIDAHIRDIVTAERGRVREWDVVNEPNSNNDFMGILGPQEMAHWFNLTREADPDARLFLNENSVLSGVKLKGLENYLDQVVDYGGPLGGIGIQGHLGFGTASPPRMLGTYDRLHNRYNVPLAITELDILVDDPQLQADYLRDVLTASFSHPAVQSVTFWGFWDGDHWKDNTPLFTKDWKAKPGLEVYKGLVFDQWWTDEKLTADADGKVELRGFLGQYEIHAAHDGFAATVPATLTRQGNTLVVKLTEKAKVKGDGPVVILKLDDFKPDGQLMSSRWQRVTKFLAERNLKASYGISGAHLEDTTPAFAEWVRKQHEAGTIEFWNHGYTHGKPKLNGKGVGEFRHPLEAQKETLEKTQRIGQEKLGVTFSAFGAPFNHINSDTARALEASDDLTVWLFGKHDLANSGGFTGTVLVRNVNLESPVHHPNFDAFLAQYEKGEHGDYLVLQGHPNGWGTPEKFENFVKIVDFLESEGAVFMTPSGYAATLNGTSE